MRGTIRRTIGACLVALALAACGSDDDSPAADSATTQATEDPRELEEGELEPGRYVAEEFAVPFRFDVREGWRAFEYRTDLVTLGRGSENIREGEIVFRVLERVYDPESGTARRVPADVAAWLRRHPELEVRSVTPDALGGLPGARVRVQAGDSATRAPGCETPCVPIAPPAADEEGAGLVVGGGGVELLLLPLGDGRTLAVHVSTQASDFRPRAPQLLQTVSFEYAS